MFKCMFFQNGGAFGTTVELFLRFIITIQKAKDCLFAALQHNFKITPVNVPFVCFYFIINFYFCCPVASKNLKKFLQVLFLLFCWFFDEFIFVLFQLLSRIVQFLQQEKKQKFFMRANSVRILLLQLAFCVCVQNMQNMHENFFKKCEKKREFLYPHGWVVSDSTLNRQNPHKKGFSTFLFFRIKKALNAAATSASKSSDVV